MAYLRVKNWETFQHYKDRSPPWIKLATDLFQDYEFGRLQDASKLLAVCCWTIAARCKGSLIPHDLGYIKAQSCLGASVTDKNLKELIDNGFLVVEQSASNPLAGRKQNAIPETERETEAEGEREGESPPTPPMVLDKGHAPDQLDMQVMFEDFWSRYPHRKAKGEARKAYERARKRETHENIIAGLGRFIAANPWRGELRYCKHPATWLNADGWADEYPASSGQPADSGTDYGSTLLRASADADRLLAGKLRDGEG